MSRLPVRIRVTLIFTGVMAVVLAGTGLFVYLRLGSELDSSIERDLRSRAGQLNGLIHVPDAGLGEAARSFLNAERGERLAQVLTADGRPFNAGRQPIRRPVLDAAEVRAAAAERTTITRTGVPGFTGQEVRLLATPVRFEGRRLIIVTGESLAGRDEELANLATLLWIGGPIALLLASLAAYGVVGAALRPVEAMRARAAEISAADTGSRLPVPPARDELQRLGETLNQMLARLEAALEREREFVDDASHELRTPLALHRTELELALRHADSAAELRAAIASAIEEVDRLSQLAEDLLVLARSDKGQLEIRQDRVEVGALLSSVSERFAARAESLQRSVDVEPSDGLAVTGDRLRLEQALGNLIDNALRYGNGGVRLWAHPTPAGVELHVADRGPGFPDAFVARALERFSRADSGRTGDGSGLGLAIVDAIARAHHGRAVVANRPGGGADAWIEVRRSNGNAAG